MSSFKQPTFQERTALAAKTKQAALEKFRARPPIDEAVLVARREAERVRDAAQLKAREEKMAARVLEKALKNERSTQNVVSDNASSPAMTEADQKLVRDAKYAARKNRRGKA